MAEYERPMSPLPTISEAASDMANAWLAVAGAASDIAHARRTLFLAYVAEGFNEAQALELVKAL